MEHKVWTFQIIGGSEFSVGVPNNPQLSHDGSLTIYHFVGSDPLSDTLFGLVSEWGCRVQRFAEIETAEQTEQHRRYIESEASLFPCMDCTKCFWLDLQVEGYCGYDSWSEDVREGSLGAYRKAREDVEACPMGKV